MAKQLSNFKAMWDAYPAPGGSAADAKRMIGGGVDVDWISNTCVVRVSRCLNYSHQGLPRDPRDEILTVAGRDGQQYAIRVQEMRRYLKRMYGAATLSHRNSGEGGVVPEAFKGKQGIIVFLVPDWTDATGHVDLWNGKECRHSGYFHKARRVELWEVSEKRRPRLRDSVGRGGANRKADVKLVQRLLTSRGFSLGAIDGACGRKTVAAIRSFQRGFLRVPDGRVDPDGRTWRELNQL